MSNLILTDSIAFVDDLKSISLDGSRPWKRTALIKTFEVVPCFSWTQKHSGVLEFCNKRVYEIPRLRRHPKVTLNQTAPDESNFWSDHPKPNFQIFQ